MYNLNRRNGHYIEDKTREATATCMMKLSYFKNQVSHLYYCIFLSTKNVILNKNELYESSKIVPKTLFKSLCDLFIKMTLKSIN